MSVPDRVPTRRVEPDGSPWRAAITAEAFHKALVSSGVIRNGEHISRIVIDAKEGACVVIHVQRFGDERLLGALAGRHRGSLRGVAMICAQIAGTYSFASERIAIRFTARDPDALVPAQYAKVAAREYDGAVLEYETRGEIAGATATFSLTEPEARALLEALAAHFGGTGPAKAARDDLLHERQRVDKLTDALISIATASSSFVPLAEIRTQS